MAVPGTGSGVFTGAPEEWASGTALREVRGERVPGQPTSPTAELKPIRFFS